jgi:hypothetical protein
MAKSAAVARAVVGIADVVGLAGITVGGKRAGREPGAGPAACDTMVGRNADCLRAGREGSRRIGRGGTGEPERTGPQPAGSLASHAIPSGKWIGV